ncbi:hypothetical protein [Kitasatospora sp. NPDC058478]|uniref:hypothetical protein n=1 Tax=unclassified Kitasatospora TaxID=2633591 RepID=UPI003669A1C6
MTDTPPLPDLADIRARFERTTNPGWRDVTDVGRLLGEIDRLRTELAAARAQHFTEAAELIRRHAEEQCEKSYSDNKIFHFNGAQRAAELLLAARTTTS